MNITPISINSVPRVVLVPILLACLLTWSTQRGSAQSRPVPAFLSKMLAERERVLDHSSASWKYDETVDNPNVTQQDDIDMRSRLLADVDQNQTTRGIRPELRDKSYNNNLRTLSKEQLLVPHMHSAATVTSGRYGETALLSADLHTQQGETSVERDVRQFLGNKIEVVNEHVTIAGSATIPKCTVWATPGDASDYMFPLPLGLCCYPGELVTLLGKSPMNLYGAQWAQVRATANEVVLQCQVTTGNLAPFTSQVSLDRRYGWAPRTIVLSRDFGGGHLLVVTVETASFKAIKSANQTFYVPSLVHVQNSGPTVSSRWWRLTSWSRSNQPLAISDTSGAKRVIDHRLQGDQVVQADFLRQDNIVSYPWAGRFLSFSELRATLKEETNTPKTLLQTSSMPTGLRLGVILIILGAVVFLIKKRSTAS